MTELAQSLKKCKVSGNTLFLPPISEGMLHNYKEVRTALLNAGAKYKSNTFVFSSDAQPFIDRLAGGESVNIKKGFQFFPTPNDIADWLIELAETNNKHVVLEPSAGQGSIINALQRKWGKGRMVHAYELMSENRSALKNISRVDILGDDFLKSEHINQFDRIIANPPFSKNQDIDHIKKMYSSLKIGGRIVSVASKHWQLSSNKKETEFKNWLTGLGAEIHNIEAGRFKESGTMISCCIIVINK